MGTKFKALLDCVEFEEKIRNAAIIEYFGNEDESEFIIDDETYYVFDKGEVKDLLRESATEDINSFVNSVAPPSIFGSTIECAYIADYIDREVIVMDIVEEFKYDSIPDYELIDSIDYFYIYKDN